MEVKVYNDNGKEVFGEEKKEVINQAIEEVNTELEETGFVGLIRKSVVAILEWTKSKV